MFVWQNEGCAIFFPLFGIGTLLAKAF